MIPEESISDADCLVLLVAHDCYVKQSLAELRHFYRNGNKNPLVLIDIKSIYGRKAAEQAGYIYWSL